jgi:hypothetical protein
MEISITKFRREMFELVNRAMDGTEIWVLYKGQRFKIMPESTVGSRLGRITPLEVINPESSGLSDSSLREEMLRAWERDWSTL